MKKVINVLASLGLAAVALSLIVFQLWTRFANIDMSETRLLIEYWREYLTLGIALTCFLCAYMWTK